MRDHRDSKKIIEGFKKSHDNRHDYAKKRKEEDPDGTRWIYFPSPDR